MELQPNLRGTLLRLRPLGSEDFELTYAAASDPLIWELHPEPTRYQRDVFERFFASGMESGGAFAILEAATSEIIGSSRYYEYDPKARSVYIGYTFLARKYWGGQYNRELKHLMLTHAFKYVDRVLFHVGDQNLRSQKALAKIGAEPFGQLNETTLIFKIDRKNSA